MKNLYIALIISIYTIGGIKAQEGLNIRNFNAENISNSELEISVDYSFARETTSEHMFIQAYPVMKDGKANYKSVLIETHSLESGDHSVNFKINKKPGGKNFTSESIRVCIIANRRNLLCEEFSFSKSWNELEDSAPEIISFTADKNLVEIGEAITLTWQSKDASTIRLGRMGSTDFREVSPNGSETVIIDRTSTFVLMASPRSAKGPSKVESRKIKIEVTNNQPVIGNFYATHPAVRRGITSKLLWNAYGADLVTLNGKTVPAIGDEIVAPERTTRYVLKAQTGDLVAEEVLNIQVTPFIAPELSFPIYSLEICKRIDTNNGYSRCISSDGPFITGDEIFIMARFKNLPKGNFNVKRITYKGFFGEDKWIKAHQEESKFENSGPGDGLLTFPIVNLGEGVKKLSIVFDDNKETTSEIIYCIDCSRIWE